MSARPPRISEADREAIRAAVIAATTDGAADKIVDRLWAKLEGDMQDRITGLIDAAAGVLESKHSPPPLDGLKRALSYLRGREVAATPTKQLKEGPWHGR